MKGGTAGPVLLVDTFSVFFRAFYALPAMTTRAGGLPTSALYGLSVLVLKLLRENEGSAWAFAMDAPGPTFRHEAFEGYKAGRDAVPEALARQLERLPWLLHSMGVPVFRIAGVEADDILATLAKRAREDGRDALVVSGDRDLLQVAHGTVRVSFIGRRGKDAEIYDEAAVVRRFGIPPQRLPTYVALVGDSADNLPAVPKLGPSTARRLCQAWSTCTDILAHADEISPPRIGDILRDHRVQIMRSEDLARLRDHVPISHANGPSWSAPTIEGLESLRNRFEELEFRSLIARLNQLIERSRGIENLDSAK